VPQALEEAGGLEGVGPIEAGEVRRWGKAWRPASLLPERPAIRACAQGFACAGLRCVHSGCGAWWHAILVSYILCVIIYTYTYLLFIYIYLSIYIYIIYWYHVWYGSGWSAHRAMCSTAAARHSGRPFPIQR
jgi:hypothetical protein